MNRARGLGVFLAAPAEGRVCRVVAREPQVLARSNSLREQRVMRDLLRRLRRTPERLLHPLQRRKLLEALRTRGRPKTVLVVCHGNICRSPVAAALLARELASLDVEVQSAGFIGFDRPPPAEAVAAAQRHS